MPENISRRRFLKLGAAALVGIVMPEATYPLSIAVNQSVNKITGLSTGNAYTRTVKEEACRDSLDKEQCIKNWRPSASQALNGTVNAPINEEFWYRAFPSLITDIDKDDAIDNIFFGTGGIKMTRREIIIGSISSLIFGVMHNFTDKGFDTKTIPASQILFGPVLWYLQRKLGIVANTVTHSIHNIKSLKVFQ